MKRAAIAVLLLAGALRADSPPRHERDVLPAGAGPNRLAVDLPLLAGAEPLRRGTREGLSDLRLFAKDGKEIPYLLVGPPREEPTWQDARVLPIAPTKTTSGFEADLGAPILVDRLEVSGIPAPYLKRVRLEGSGDRARWTLLVSEGTLFDLPDERLTRTWLAFAPGELRYFRLTWDDAKSGRVLPPRSVRARRPASRAAAAPLRVAMPFTTAPAERGRSRYRVRLPAPRLPIESVELVPDAENVLREARVTELRLQGSTLAPVTLGSATLRRAARGDVHADALAIPVDVPQEREIEVVVEDGDNPPLSVREIALVFAPLPSIFFESPSDAPLAARFGTAGARVPHYDLEAMRDAVEKGRVAAKEARWGERRDLASAAGAAPAASPVAPGAALEENAFRFARPVPDGPPGLTSLLLDAHVLANAPSLASVRLADDAHRQIPYLVEMRGDALKLPLAPLAPASLPKDARGAPPRSTVYRVTLPIAGLPDARLVVGTAARVFTRTAVLLVESPDDDRSGGLALRTIASTTWAHADTERDAPTLVLEVPRLDTTTAYLAIDDGDNAPLPLTTPTLETRAARVRFFRPAGAVRLLYGGDADAPRYDLSLLAARFLAEPAHELALTGAPPAAATEGPHVAKTLFWGVLVVAVVLLLAIIAKLVRTEETPARP